MNTFCRVFYEENWLQIADHLSTVVFGVATFVLTIIIFRLSKRDKTKTIAINELEKQTNQLKVLYENQTLPRFIAEFEPGIIFITNIGGDCYNIKIEYPENWNNSSNRDPFKNWSFDFFSSHQRRKINISDCGDNDFIIKFRDISGNKLQQTLLSRKGEFTNVLKNE